MNYQHYNVLIVDDNPHILSSLPALLSPHFNIIKTLDGPYNLLTVLDQEHFDIIMLDMNFASGASKGEEGLKCLQDILQHHPKALVVLLAGSECVDLAMKGVQEGAADFIMKPWNPEKLLLNLRFLLRLHYLEDELKRLMPRSGQKGRAETLNLQEVEKQCIQKAIYAYDGNMSHAAKQLGITRATLYAKIKKYFGEDDRLHHVLQGTKK